MAFRHLKYNFTKETDGDFLTTSNHIYQCMFGNANFLTPNPSLPDFNTGIGVYATSLGKAEGGTHADVMDKNAKRKALQLMLNQLAGYCETTSVDPEILVTSGFPLAKTRAKIGVLAKPENMKVVPGANKGTMEVSVNTVPHRNYYVYQYTDAPSSVASVWITLTSQKKKLIIAGLTEGKEYVFRVAAAGADASRVWSDEITSFVL